MPCPLKEKTRHNVSLKRKKNKGKPGDRAVERKTKQFLRKTREKKHAWQ